MDINNLLGGLGLLACVGAIVVVAIVAFAFRALAARNQAANNQGSNMWNTPGSERPQYDNPDIQSQGGFGGVPTTGVPRDVDLGRTGDPDLGVPPSNAPETDLPTGGAQNYPRRERDRRDDDQINSGGGFGG